MRSPHKLKAAVALATWLPLVSSYPAAQSPANAKLPLLMIHGGADAVIELPWAQASAAAMRKAGRTVDFNVVEGAPHAFGSSFFSVAQQAVAELKARGLS
jgi:predicted esterase